MIKKSADATADAGTRITTKFLAATYAAQIIGVGVLILKFAAKLHAHQ